MLYIVPLVMLLLGLATIALALFGCFGIALVSKTHSILFFTANVLLVILEISLGAYWWVEHEKFIEVPQLLNMFLMEDINSGEDWATMQIKVTFYNGSVL